MERTYETVFITLPTLTDDEERIAVDALAAIVADGGGVFTTKDRMGRRRLAYPIKKFEDGVYTRFLYDADGAVPKELDRRLRISDKVIRHMTVSMELDWAAAAKVQAVKDAEAKAAAEAAIAAGLVPPQDPAAEPPRPRSDDREEDAPEFGDED